MQDRAFKNDKISFIWNKQVTRVLGEDKVSGIEMTDTVTGEQSTLNVTGIFVAIGHRPNTDLFKGILQMEGSTYTNIDGVFACGDVQDHIYRQAITAAGSGCMAAIDCERWLEAQHS
jgi:thioredoxin reductase (NADPH)